MSFKGFGFFWPSSLTQIRGKMILEMGFVTRGYFKNEAYDFNLVGDARKFTKLSMCLLSFSELLSSDFTYYNGGWAEFLS